MAETDPGSARPKPRALILDLFGDYLRYAGGEAKAGDLVTLLGAFGVEPATVRMTLTRLRREHWFTTRREGRESSYVLSAHLLDVLQQGRERIFADYDEPWDQHWTTVVQQNEKPDRSTRDQLRRQLSWLGFGSLTVGTWMTPRDRAGEARALAAEFPDVHFTVLRASTGDLEADRDVVARCWDLDRINRMYEQFLAANAHVAGSGAALRGADALVARTNLIGGYRHFPFVDPWLPKNLRPASWLGAEANELFRSAHRELGPAATAFVSEVVGGPIDGPQL
ncbi:PaaX family transcriptional regulator C-terminal domain-containing protein [Promicromonospora panici]|uniref:PaaX family transcriptional regulator n=1 Tax=Promicromonospora panici TaxID=2219658 RepID=UPI00101B9A8D|nr:PaaX family transcriptional regulator C-terminal domain-containing protein [Promicromonospora panici]